MTLISFEFDLERIRKEGKDMAEMGIEDIPKIELHCHLDGSLGLELTQSLLAKRGESYTLEELREKLQAPLDCQDLSEYLQRFDLPNEVLQTEEELKAAAFDLAKRAADENVRYLETRFAPKFSTAEGLTVKQVLAAVESGFADARQKYNIHTGIIVCGMRGMSENANLSMLKDAMELYGSGVVGCDLAGDEKAYPVHQYQYFFEKAKEYGIPFTIHAGEQGDKENIRGSIEFGASRIGHGIAMLKDKELQQLCVDKNVGVELCPTSNLQTKAVNSFAGYPFREFFDAGIKLSINTDNRTVSGTDMTKELSRILFSFPMEEQELKKVYHDSVDMAFAGEDVKHELWKAFR